MREAGQRYQRTLRGGQRHAARQARYRARQLEKVTHHPSQLATSSGTEVERQTSAALARSPDDATDSPTPVRALPLRATASGGGSRQLHIEGQSYRAKEAKERAAAKKALKPNETRPDLRPSE